MTAVIGATQPVQVLPRMSAGGGGGTTVYALNVDVKVSPLRARSRYDFELDEGDRSPSLQVTVYDLDADPTGATPFNFTGWGTLRFQMREVGVAASKVDDTANTAYQDRTGGVLRYDWQAADVDTAGLYVAKFEATAPGGEVASFPAGRKLSIHVAEGL